MSGVSNNGRTINVTLYIEGDAALYQCSAIEQVASPL
jgi:hypothetical protein